MGGSIRTAILGAAALVLASHASRAADFYAGKIINIYVGTGENAGAVSEIPRAMVDVMSNHIPGHPTFVIRFMPGAGGIKAANYIYSIAPQDGTVYGFITRGFILAPLLTDKAHFDPSKFNWIGSPLAQPSVGAVWNASTKVRTIQDAMRVQTVMGATSMGQDTGVFPTMLNRFIGTKFKIVSGYKSSPDIELAMERGEVTGKIGWTWGALNSGHTANWLKDGKITLLVQLGLTKYPEIPANVPLALDLAKDSEARQVMELLCAPSATGYPSFMGPGVPKDRIEIMRAAYGKTMADPRFRSAMKQMNLEVQPVRGEEIESIVKRIYAMPSSVGKQARELMPPSL
jgi:tripartite-type tricarboxylate transporter receptor subunit TctC